MPRSLHLLMALVATGALLLPARDALADVSPRNGNFFVRFTDVKLPGSLELKVERVYNSKTAYKGIFGWGWGTEYEMYLDVLGDGSVALHEYGGGAENFFLPPALSAREVDNAVEQLAAARAGEAAMTADSSIAYRAKLRDDATYRSAEWRRLVREGRVAPRVLPEGTRLRSMRFGLHDIVKSADGFVRTQDNRPTHHFDGQGRLVRVTRARDWIALDRDADGRVTTITDRLGRRVTLGYTARGLVERLAARAAADEPEQVTRYAYDDRDDLVEVTTADGDVMQLGYDERHNLIRYAENEEPPTRITYHPASLQENVHTVTTPEGLVRTYTYGTDPADSLRVIVRMTEVDGIAAPDEADTAVTTYAYTLRRRANGDEWTERVVSTANGVATDARYSECCGLPVMIIGGRGGDTTTFEYDRQGRVTRKETARTLDSIAYEPRAGKISEIVRLRKGDPERRWTRFSYDAGGLLLAAENHEGQFVKLEYNGEEKIVRMTGTTGVLRFAYNAMGKPVLIEHETAGHINVAYASNGEIEKVDSPGGHQVALTVTQAFQSLLSLVNMKDLSVCRVSFSAAICSGVEKPMREPEAPGTPAGEACRGGEAVCRVGGGRR